MNPLLKSVKIFLRINVLLLLFTTVPIFAITATFNVDMTKQINTGKFNITSDKVYLRGTFNNWEQNAEMIKDPSSFIYSVSIQVEPFTYYEYKYFITSAGASNGGYEDSVGGAHGNRYFNFLRFDKILPVDFFNNEEPFSDNITITSPGAGECWVAGSSHNIMWNAPGIANVKLEYTSNRGETWETIVPSVPASGGSYNWLVPDIVSYEWRIRISDAANPADVEYSTGFLVTYSDIASSVPPLLKVEYPVFNWPLNAYYPPTTAADNENINGKVGNACGPTAMTNIMRYWEYPRKGTNSRTFTDYLGCVWSADFAGTVYNHDRMPKNIPYDAPDSVYEAVATLMYHTGAGMHSMWRSGGQDGVLEAFHEYFNYSRKSKFIERDYYTPEQWEKVVKSELSAGRPLITASLNHWFIVDGYTEDNLFHVRWDYGEERDEYLPLYRSGAAEQRNWILAYLEPELNGRYLQLISPNGNENLKQTGSFNITWESSLVSEIQIEYSTNNGYDWITITSNFPASSGSYSWNVSADVSSQCRIRISASDDINIYDKSDNVFSVYDVKELNLVSPTHNYWQSGTVIPIRWSSKGIPEIILQYSTDDGSTWIDITETGAVPGVYKWTIPDVSSVNCMLKLSDKSDPSFTSVSNIFTIGNQEVTGGPYIKDDNTVALLHFDNDFVNEFSSTSPGQSYNDVSFSPNFNMGLDYGVRIDNSGTTSSVVNIPDYNAIDLSGNWTIELWFKINSWGTGIAAYPFLLCKFGANYFITLSPSNKTLTAGYDYEGGAESVTLPQNSLAPGKWYHLTYIRNTSNNTLKCLLHDSTRQIIASVSGAFNPAHSPKITTEPVGIGGINGNGNIQFDGYVDEVRISNAAREFRNLNLTSPNGGENLIAGSIYNITWTSRDILNLKLEYSTNGGSAWTSIVNNLNSASSSYNWTVPNVNSQNCKLRISDQSDASYYYVTENVFSIIQLPSLSLVKPNGGENWQAETTHNITWTSTNVAQIKLEYSVDNGTNWTLIKDSIDASILTHSWKIPNTPSTTCKVRISALSDSSVNDISNNPFTISEPASIQLIKPNGGERLYSGSQYEIKWYTQGFTNARLKYSTNNGTNWILISTVGAASGKYIWTIPNVFSKNCKVQISSTTIAGKIDESDAVFTISPIPSILVKSPNGGEKYIPGTTQLITWSSNYVDSIKIEYCTNGGTDWKIISENIPADSGKINWLIPAVTSNNCFVKISDAADTLISDISNESFTIDAVSSVFNGSGIPDKFELLQNYPNPFNPSSRIRYQLPKQSFVRIILYDILGNEIQKLVNEIHAAGYYEIEFDGTNLGSGIYLIKMDTDEYTSVRKMILMK